MKIRIKGNAIRLRLTKTEVEMFSATGCVEETTHFGSSVFTYAVEAKEQKELLDVQFKDNTLTLFVEKQEGKGWYSSSKVGFSNTLQQKENTTLSLLLEKDFVCLDERGEDASDLYDNPKGIRKA